MWKSAIVIRDKPWGQRSVPFLDVVWADRPTQLGWICVATDSQLEVPAKKRDATSDYSSSDQEIRQGPALTRCALARAFWWPATIDLDGPGNWCREVRGAE